MINIVKLVRHKIELLKMLPPHHAALGRFTFKNRWLQSSIQTFQNNWTNKRPFWFHLVWMSQVISVGRALVSVILSLSTKTERTTIEGLEILHNINFGVFLRGGNAPK